ncbi:hypothetical protein [Sphingomonas koreensis]
MISVGRILEGAFGVLRVHFVAVAIWGCIYLAGNIAMVIAMRPMMSQMLNPGFGQDPEAAVAAMGPFYLVGLLLGIVATILYTASMRSVLRPDAGGIAFLRLGMDELRILGLLILFGIGSFVLFFTMSLVIGMFAGGMAAGSESVALTILLSVLVGIVLFGVLLYLIVRLSLAFPLTLHRRAFAIGEAWRLSRGHFWTLFGAALVVSVIGFVLSTAVNMVAMGGYFADIMSAAGDPEAAVQAMERQAAAANSFGTLMILQSIGGSIVAAIWLALSGGSVAAAARLLIDDEFDDAEDVFG